MNDKYIDVLYSEYINNNKIDKEDRKIKTFENSIIIQENKI